MKHRALSMLLALVMVVSLLPAAAIANGTEENTGAEEQKETVEMGENDPQQGGDGEGSQLPTAKDEESAIQLYVEKEDGEISYTRYQSDENVRLPWLFYKASEDFAPIIPTFVEKGAQCYAIQKNDNERTKIGELNVIPGNEENGGQSFILWLIPSGLDWVEAEKADYVLMFHCNDQWYKLDAQLCAGSAPLVGELVLQYNGNNYFNGDTIEFAAGTNEVSLMARDVDNWEMISSKTGLSVDGKVVTGLEPFERTTGEGNKITLWDMTLAGPEIGSTATGWIKFEDKNGNESRINIKSLSAHGRKVEDSDMVTARFDDDWNFIVELDGKIYQGNVAKFNWPEGSSNEYYLAACEWRDKLLDISPKDYGDRVLMHGANELMYISARVFQRVAGESGGDVKYILNEDVRAQMEEAGYTFNIVPHPVDGNVNYPARETVEMASLSPQGENMQLDWKRLYYGDPTTAGWWAYEAQLVKGSDEEAEVIARCFSSEQFRSATLHYKDLKSTDVEVINREIAETLKDCPAATDYTMQMVEFTLPAGTIEGLIVIPETDCFVDLIGAGNNEGVISTTIKGGIKLEGASCDFSSICFNRSG